MKGSILGQGRSYAQLGRYTLDEVRAAGWAEKLIDNQDGAMLGNAAGTLHYDDHRRMMDDVTMVRQYEDSVYDILVAAPGIAQNVSLFETMIGDQDMNDFSGQVSMNVSDRQSQQTDYAFNWTPQPIYHCDFHIPWRQTGFGYKPGDGASAATIAVNLVRDQTLILGNASIAVNANGAVSTLTGLTNAAGTLAQAASMTDWSLVANVASVYPEAVAHMQTMFTTDRAAQTPNSVLMLVANDIWPALEFVNNAGNSERTNLERLKAMSAIKDVKPCQWLVDGAVLYIEITPSSVRIPRSAETTIAPWLRTERFEDSKFTVFSASTNKVLQDRNGRSGVSYCTKA